LPANLRQNDRYMNSRASTQEKHLGRFTTALPIHVASSQKWDIFSAATKGCLISYYSKNMQNPRINIGFSEENRKSTSPLVFSLLKRNDYCRRILHLLRSCQHLKG
jgi:hypothetical protein